jgi:hypothetical protein
MEAMPLIVSMKMSIISHFWQKRADLSAFILIARFRLLTYFVTFKSFLPQATGMIGMKLIHIRVYLTIHDT